MSEIENTVDLLTAADTEKDKNKKHAAKITDNDKAALLSSGDETNHVEEYTDIFGEQTGQFVPSSTVSNLVDGKSVSVSEDEIMGYTGDVDMYTDTARDDDDDDDEGNLDNNDAMIPEGTLVNLNDSKGNSPVLEDKNETLVEPVAPGAMTKSLSNDAVVEIVNKLEEVKLIKKPGQPVKVKDENSDYAAELGLKVKIDSLDDESEEESAGYISSGDTSQQPMANVTNTKKKKLRKRTTSYNNDDNLKTLEEELNSSGEFVEQNGTSENRHIRKERKKRKEKSREEVVPVSQTEERLIDLGPPTAIDAVTTQLANETKNVPDATTTKPQKSSKTSNSHRKRTRHKVYLDDPDIHQLISDHVSLLHRFIEDVQSGKHLQQKQSQQRQLQQQQQQQQPFAYSYQNTQHHQQKQIHNQHQVYASTKSLPGSFPGHPQANNLHAAQSVHGVNHQGYSSIGPYDAHRGGGVRGKNLITRIRNDEMSTSSDEDDIRHSGHGKDICPDCGEYHPPDNQMREIDDICPDCGVRHNPYEHGPNEQKPWQKYVDACHDRVKPGQRYEQVSTEQDPQDVKEDTLPSIEGPHTTDDLREGVRYPLKYLGSSQIVTQHPVTKETRMQQAQEAYNRIKGGLDDEDEDDVSTTVDMFISLERIKILNKDTKFEDIMMDHALRTVCFICDMGKILVLMARRLTSDTSTDFSIEEGKPISLGTIVGDRERKTSKNICHVFEGEIDASIIAKAIGQAFNIAYRQFLQSNGIAHEHVEEAEYCHVLESQKLVGQDLDRLTDQSNSKDVVVVKKRGEAIGIMLLESGWGSMLPTVFIAHLANYSPAARCQQLSVGDHVLSCNGSSLVGLPLSEANTVLRNARAENRVTLKIVTCPPVVDVVVSRPDTKFQLGFSVQNGTICSLLRGGIAERGGIRVGHRIIDINGVSVVAKSHQYIVDILANTIGSIGMKTMPVAMYRLMVGDDQPTHI